MKNVILMLVVFVLAAATVASATINVPAGMTGLWRFENSADNMAATIGQDMVAGDAGNGFGSLYGPWTSIGYEWHGDYYADGGVINMSEWGYLKTYHGISANGGGTKVNEYTIAIDYVQTSDLGDWNALMQTNTDNAHGDDADWWTKADGTIGVGDVGYSTKTFARNSWHRLVLSVDNGNFFKVYVDGELYLDGAGQAVDGRFALGDHVNLFADNSWNELGWGLVGTVAVWDNALTDAQVAAMGGWLNGATAPTPLVIPEPASMTLLALGGLALLKRKRQ